MATKMTKGTTRGNAAVLGTNKILKKGGKVKKYKSGGMPKFQDAGQKGKTYPYISPTGAIYMTENDYKTGRPNNPGSGAAADYLSKQDSTTQRRTGYTAVTNANKLSNRKNGGVAKAKPAMKKGGMVKSKKK